MKTSARNEPSCVTFSLTGGVSPFQKPRTLLALLALLVLAATATSRSRAKVRMHDLKNISDTEPAVSARF